MVRGYGQAIAGLWRGTLDAYVTETAVDEDTGRNVSNWVLALEAVPCHLSVSGRAALESRDGVAHSRQTATLFCAKDVVIPLGARLRICQRGRVGLYVQTGVAAVYGEHQEVGVELEEQIV